MSHYASTSNCPIRKLILWHVSMKLIAISRLTSSILSGIFKSCQVNSFVLIPALFSLDSFIFHSMVNKFRIYTKNNRERLLKKSYEL